MLPPPAVATSSSDERPRRMNPPSCQTQLSRKCQFGIQGRMLRGSVRWGRHRPKVTPDIRPGEALPRSRRKGPRAPVSHGKLELAACWPVSISDYASRGLPGCCHSAPHPLREFTPWLFLFLNFRSLAGCSARTQALKHEHREGQPIVSRDKL